MTALPWALDNAEEARRLLRNLTTRFEENYPDAATSPREGVEETLTVQRLAISGLLRKTLSTTNAIESGFDIVRDRTRNVKYRQIGSMVKRWAGAALLEAETCFRHIRGYGDIPMLRAAICRLTAEKRAESSDSGAATAAVDTQGS